MKPTILVDAPHHNAEVPLWHSGYRCLYWTDIPTGRVFRHYPHNGKTEQIYSGKPVGGMTIQADGSLLMFKAGGTIERWHEGEITTIVDEIPAAKETRFNDAIADPQGRVFSGTVGTSENPGNLYRLDPDGSLHQILGGLSMPNGMGFTRDRQQFYFTDSERHAIYRFNYNEATGEISDRQNFVLTPLNEGVPDGLTVDSQGYVWSARWDGGHIFRYTPQGKEVLRIPFPTKKVSCLTFGGDDYRQIFVTTAGGDDRDRESAYAGAIFQFQSDVRGVPEFPSRILL